MGKYVPYDSSIPLIEPYKCGFLVPGKVGLMSHKFKNNLWLALVNVPYDMVEF